MVFLKFNKTGKFVWVVVAYSPLFIALLIKFQVSCEFNNFANKYLITVSCSIILGIFIFVFWRTLKYTEDTNSRPEKCIISQSNNSEYILFIVSYLIPFYNINFTQSNIISTVFMLFIIGIFYARTPLFAVNPLLNLLNYNLYKVKKYHEKKEIILISKEKLLLDCYNIKLIQLSEDIYISDKINEGGK